MRALFSSIVLLITCASVNAQSEEKRKWIKPDHVLLQYAGSIGLVSGGIGYDIFRKKGKLDFMFGYTPAYNSSSSLKSLTIKATTHPLRVTTKRAITIAPLNIGMYLTYTPGRKYSSDLPAWYPDGYYWWSEALRLNIFLGGNATFAINRIRKEHRLSPYYEIGTNEVKLVSYIQNRHALDLMDILHGSVGLRYHFTK
jgi:hypothetical protein